MLIYCLSYCRFVVLNKAALMLSNKYTECSVEVLCWFIDLSFGFIDRFIEDLLIYC